MLAALCFVVDDRRVVLGRLGRRAIRGREDVSVEEAMTPGPSTIRPSARLRNVVERMRTQNLTTLPVTSSDGRLIGLLTRHDVGAPSTVRRLKSCTEEAEPRPLSSASRSIRSVSFGLSLFALFWLLFAWTVSLR